MTALPPSPRPCTSCPYRRDVPSGVWDASEYAKLPRYDEPTFVQPTAVFLCHQHDRGDDAARACGGWAGCHDGDELLALRVGVASGEITVETAGAIRDYESPVPLFASGVEAAAHGMREVHRPGVAACTAMAKITRVRSDINQGDHLMTTALHPLADILSITTGRLLSRQHIGGVYTILNHLTGENLMTHQLPRAATACAPALLEQHPQLVGVSPPEDIDVPDLMAWLLAAEARYGEELPVRPIADWQHQDPIEELCDMVGAERVFVVTLPAEATP